MDAKFTHGETRTVKGYYLPEQRPIKTRKPKPRFRMVYCGPTHMADSVWESTIHHNGHFWYLQGKGITYRNPLNSRRQFWKL